MARRLTPIAVAVAVTLSLAGCGGVSGAAGATTVGSSATAPAAAHPAPRRLVLLGDSLIYGLGLPADDDFASVISRDRPDLEVLNAGVPGNTTSDALARVRNVTDVHPATVVVWLGTNDAVVGVPSSTYATQLTKLLDLMAPAREVLVTPIDVRLAPGAFKPYAAAVRDIAAQRGLALVDLAPEIRATDYLVDGVHLDADAVVRIAHLIERQIG